MPLRKLPTFDVLDWNALEGALLSQGYGLIRQVLDHKTCHGLIALFDQGPFFRKRIVMERHNFGRGEYSYFSYPLPNIVSHLRTELFRYLVPIANRFNDIMKRQIAYPPTLELFQKHCRATGQTQPTPLILRYEAGGYNCLHRDLYGVTAFPFQAMIVLNQQGKDFEGGEFVLVENRPRQQSRALVVNPNQGDLLIFPVSDRPVPGKRGMLRASMRHGVSPISAGQRWVLGVIFHDAK